MKTFIREHWAVVVVAFFLLAVMAQGLLVSFAAGDMRDRCIAAGDKPALIDGVLVCLKTPITIINMDDK